MAQPPEALAALFFGTPPDKPLATHFAQLESAAQEGNAQAAFEAAKLYRTCKTTLRGMEYDPPKNKFDDALQAQCSRLPERDADYVSNFVERAAAGGYPAAVKSALSNPPRALFVRADAPESLAWQRRAQGYMEKAFAAGDTDVGMELAMTYAARNYPHITEKDSARRVLNQLLKTAPENDRNRAYAYALLRKLEQAGR